MSGGVVAAMARAYRDPRAEMVRQIDDGLSEARALMHLLLACFLGLVASLPNAVRGSARLEIDDALTAVVSAHAFGYLFVAPLLLYGLAALLHLAARPFGGLGGLRSARAALFWAALLGGPIALAIALTGVAVEIVAGPRMSAAVDYLTYAGFGYWLWLFAAGFAEAEGFRATGRVAAAVAAAALGAAVALGALSGATPAVG